MRTDPALARARAAIQMAAEVAQAVNSGQELDEVCELMASWLRRLIDLQWGSVSLLDDTNAWLESRALTRAVEIEIDRTRHSVQGSLMGYVVLSQRPLFIEDVGDASLPLPERPWLQRQGLGSVAIVPVVFRDKIIGTLNLGSGTANQILRADQPTIMLLADLLALALGRARADVVRRRQAMLHILSEVGRVAHGTLDLDRMLADVAALLRDHFSAGYVAFSVLDAPHRAVLRAAAYGQGLPGPPLQSQRPVGDELWKRVITDGMVALEPSARDHRPLVAGEWCQVLLSLHSGERVRGMLEVGRRSDQPFSEEDLDLLATLSDRIGGALDTAALFAEVERSNRELADARDELTILYEIGRTATSTLDLDRILGPVAKMIGESFGYEFVALFLARESELELRALASREGATAAPGEPRPDTVKVRLAVSAQANAGSLVRDVARVRETLIVANIAKNPRAAPLLPSTQSTVAIPLKVGARLVGVLAVESTRINAFDLEDVRMLETLSDQLATAIDNARLYRELLAANEKQAQTFSELRAVQDDLMQATRLAALGEMSGRVAHEVLNPMTGILARVQSDLRTLPSPERSGVVLMRKIFDRWLEAYRNGAFLEVLQEELSKKGGERYLALMGEILNTAAAGEAQIREDLAFIERHSLRVVKIVDSLRGLARQSQARERVAIKTMVHDSVELVRDACEKRGIQIHEVYAESLPQVEVDPSEIVQVLSNVLRNAFQCIESKGGGGHVAVEVTHAAGMVEVRVRDTGTGIRAEHVPRLFDQDFTTKDPSTGTGLGLAICRRFLRGYGGDIVLEWTAEGVGSVFLLTIPAAAPAR